MEKYIFTDLACEASWAQFTPKKQLAERIYRLEMTDKTEINKKYITYFTPKLWEIDDDEFFAIHDAATSDLRRLISEFRGSEKSALSVLVVGMGNPYFSADSLGVETAKKIKATRLAKCSGRSTEVAVVIPDVMGNTGIETFDTVLAYSQIVAPDVIIIIDSLASKSILSAFSFFVPTRSSTPI